MIGYIVLKTLDGEIVIGKRGDICESVMRERERECKREGSFGVCLCVVLWGIWCGILWGVWWGMYMLWCGVYVLWKILRGLCIGCSYDVCESDFDGNIEKCVGSVVLILIGVYKCVIRGMHDICRK